MGHLREEESTPTPTDNSMQRDIRASSSVVVGDGKGRSLQASETVSSFSELAERRNCGAAAADRTPSSTMERGLERGSCGILPISALLYYCVGIVSMVGDRMPDCWIKCPYSTQKPQSTNERGLLRARVDMMKKRYKRTRLKGYTIGTD